MEEKREEEFTFGPYKKDRREVFYSTTLSYALVNIRPALPEHVLVIPRREVKRFTDLTDDEIIDLSITAKLVGARLEQYHNATSVNFGIQDGRESGQTVPHVHIHIIPRKIDDYKNHYKLDDEAMKRKPLDIEDRRKKRTIEEMNLEADAYRVLF
ncbi:hypothetical protein LUZ60_012012 [Juncus effusus]|nr:hypothetical protein LUZ60_012012 [Juncus effusus]